MAEAIICRRGKSGNGDGTGSGILQIQTFTYNTNFMMPNHIGNVLVRIFGGGGAGMFIRGYGTSYIDCYAGGGGGWMNNGEFIIQNGLTIPIVVGAGGVMDENNISHSGGTTSFGGYLSANGGSAPSIGIAGSGGSGGGLYFQSDSSTIVTGGRGYQFGGGGVSIPLRNDSGTLHVTGGQGGTWGGGGGVSVVGSTLTGTGSQFGKIVANGGNGGTYGGGGSVKLRKANCVSYATGYKGTYGGNGGIDFNNVIGNVGSNKSSKNGTNTMSNTSVPENCRGYGIGGSSNGGGGGYGGNGGAGSGGGGGGYGGNGGSCYSSSYNAGGGGGYGKGADGGRYGYGGGGGGYFAPGGNDRGGGASYGRGGDTRNNAEFGGGGGGDLNHINGADGIVIIQYYI